MLMRRIDAFAHILPSRYLVRLERHLKQAMAPAQLRYYREGVFRYDEALTDLDARWRAVEPFSDYAQVLVLAVPPIEEIGPPRIAAEFAALANDEMAELVPHFSSRLAMGPGYRQVKDNLPRPPLVYFKRFYADTALFGAPTAVQCVLDFFGPDHVLFGTDMPLGPPSAIEATIADLEASDLTESQKDAVYAGNAARVLGVVTRR